MSAGIGCSVLRSLRSEVAHELAGKTVRHPAIPDDYNEATILSVGEPENVEFTFDELEHHGDADIGIPFTSTVDCDLHYAIFKSDYHCFDENHMERISICDLNRHYYDAEENYTFSIKWYITILINPAELQERQATAEPPLEELMPAFRLAVLPVLGLSGSRSAHPPSIATPQLATGPSTPGERHFRNGPETKVSIARE